MVRLFDAEFGFRKRYPLKTGQTKNNPPIVVTKIDLNKILVANKTSKDVIPFY